MSMSFVVTSNKNWTIGYGYKAKVDTIEEAERIIARDASPEPDCDEVMYVFKVDIEPALAYRSEVVTTGMTFEQASGTSE